MRKLSGGNFFPQGFFPLVIKVFDLREALATTRPVGCAIPTSSECVSCHQAGSNNKGLIIFW